MALRHSKPPYVVRPTTAVLTRGFDPSFNLWILGPDPIAGVPLGGIYGFVKDVFALLVLAGVAAFVYLRVVRREKRMTLSGEGLLILGIIATMMIADLSYDGAAIQLAHRHPFECPGGSLAGHCESAAEIIAPLAAAAHEPVFMFAEPGGSLRSGQILTPR